MRKKVTTSVFFLLLLVLGYSCTGTRHVLDDSDQAFSASQFNANNSFSSKEPAEAEVQKFHKITSASGKEDCFIAVTPVKKSFLFKGKNIRQPVMAPLQDTTQKKANAPKEEKEDDKKDWLNGYNLSALAGFASAVVSIFIGGFLLALAGAVLGYIALREIKKTGEKGAGFAYAAIAIGVVSFLTYLFAWALALLLMAIWFLSFFGILLLGAGASTLPAIFFLLFGI